MGPIGVPEMVAIFVIALLLFGPKKLPELGRTLGKALTEFRRAKNELKSTFESHLNELDREVNLKATMSAISRPTPTEYTYTQGDYGHYDSDYHSSAGSLEPSHLEAAGTAQSTTASATATQDAQAHRDLSSQTPTVNGAVPRSTGSQPAADGSVVSEEQHLA